MRGGFNPNIEDPIPTFEVIETNATDLSIELQNQYSHLMDQWIDKALEIVRQSSQNARDEYIDRLIDQSHQLSDMMPKKTTVLTPPAMGHTFLPARIIAYNDHSFSFADQPPLVNILDKTIAHQKHFQVSEDTRRSINNIMMLPYVNARCEVKERWNNIMMLPYVNARCVFNETIKAQISLLIDNDGLILAQILSLIGDNDFYRTSLRVFIDPDKVQRAISFIEANRPTDILLDETMSANVFRNEIQALKEMMRYGESMGFFMMPEGSLSTWIKEASVNYATPTDKTRDDQWMADTFGSPFGAYDYEGIILDILEGKELLNNFFW